jgi:hypothetical protein
MREGWADVDVAGRARVHLLRDNDQRRYFTALNFLRAALGWCLPERGGALVHAAGLVIDGRAFLLVGPEGSGKSTWSRFGENAGARVISDDLVLLDGAGERPEILGAPFRSTHRTDYRPGRWPLGGVLFPVHGAEPALGPVAPLLARARLTANLPFLIDLEEGAARGARVVDRLVERVPFADLTFGLDPSFVGLLRSLA